jgi:hypothetical protein
MTFQNSPVPTSARSLWGRTPEIFAPGIISTDMYNQASGMFRKPVSLGPEVNSEAHEGNPFIAPDGGYLIFGRGGLWINFKRNDGSWTKARNMGEVFTGALCPSVSPDEKTIFFLSLRQDLERDVRRILLRPIHSMGCFLEILFIGVADVAELLRIAVK